jgi:hypothetical protein
MGACPLLDVAPTACTPVFPDAVPGPRTRDERARARGAAIPGPRAAGARGRVRHDRWRGGQWLTVHARAAHRRAWAQGGRFVPRGLTIKRADYGVVVSLYPSIDQVLLEVRAYRAKLENYKAGEVMQAVGSGPIGLHLGGYIARPLE